MNIAWSPVAMPVARERRFIIRATTISKGWEPAIATSNRPHGRAASAAAISRSASAGNSVSAWRNNSAVPLAAAAPALSWAPRPRGAAITRVACGLAASTVPSVDPPSTTITSAPRRTNG